MTAIGASAACSHRAQRQVVVIDDDKQFFGRAVKIIADRFNCCAGPVHESPGFYDERRHRFKEHPGKIIGFRPVAGNFIFKFERKRIGDPEADIMPRMKIPLPRITQTEKQNPRCWRQSGSGFSFP